jgi:hypothetical protein
MLLLVTSLALVSCAVATAFTIFLGLIKHGEILFYEHNTVILYTEAGVCLAMALWGVAMVIHCAKRHDGRKSVVYSPE